MTYDDPTPTEAEYYDSLLQSIVFANGEKVNELISAYYGDDPIALAIGLSSGDARISAEFVGGPDGPVRVGYGVPGNTDHHIIINSGEDNAITD